MQRMRALTEVGAIVTLLLKQKADPNSDIARKTHSAIGSWIAFQRCASGSPPSGSDAGRPQS
jgi:hypothetical protein